MSWVVGALLSASVAALRDKASIDRSQRRDLEVRPSCAMSIVLVGVDDSRVARAIDAATGSRGFSHVLFDPCRVVDGKPMVVDYTVRRGVHWSTLAPYEHRRIELVTLDPQTAAETWGCVRSQLGRGFRPVALLAGHSEAGSCVGLIASCLPWSLQEAMRPFVEGPCISPNTLARYFGVV